MKNYSIWLENISVKNCKSVQENLDVDVLIVGGGISGLSTIYQLKDSGLSTILVERNICGHGVTSRSTAKITYLQEKIYMNIRKYDVNKAKKYLESQIEAVKTLKRIIDTENIDCDLNKASSYLFTDDEMSVKKIKEEYQFLKDMGIMVEFVKSINKENCKLGLKVSDTYVFHPLKYINHLKEMFYNSIYENSQVTNIKRENGYYVCFVNDYIIKARHVVIATHYPYFLLPLMMPTKTHVETSYVGAFKTNQYREISAINIDKPTKSFRYHKDDKLNYMVYLYNSFMSCNVKSIKDNFKKLESKYKFDYVWSNKDIITNDYLPYIGCVYGTDNTFLIACGYNTWGMTNGTLAGKLLADIILKKDNPYIELFSPNRSFNLSKLVRFPVDIGSSLKAIVKSTKSNTNNSNVVYKKIDGVDVAIYKDSDGKEHIVKNKCPHMKCGVVFNEIEKTWDCLCHGSRFNIDGKCIEGPSNYDISLETKRK